ncbi:MAG: transglutaminase domain-containing protein [Deltaproteobacteria bacterium]|nr:transglutaminase domain-containing protein [Deltaproteobacteria bacterium]
MKNNETDRMKQNAVLTVRLLMIAVICIAVSACAGSVQPKYLERDIESTTAEVIAGATTDAEKLEWLFLYVRDEIDFNWAYPQDIPPEKVLKNGFGVCMQKANLLSAMARQAGFQTRFRFVYVRKQALEDFLPSYIYGKWADGPIPFRTRWWKSCIRERGVPLIHPLTKDCMRSAWTKR